MKDQLIKAIEHGKYFLDLYKQIPTGMFGAVMIQQDISEGEKILNNFENTDEAVVKHVIEKLEAIE